ncbi:MAG: hypothetical protein DRO73_11650 [Candidatus Thorarchaeota archaeon]|nr:MAG: hypothetical protein DRO73_11650 [Candidatus Thorarchaeota archaeon]
MSSTTEVPGIGCVFQCGHPSIQVHALGIVVLLEYPIAECDNVSRVIKYVAVLGYCYSSYDVVEMRVHDIRVIADLNRHDPTAPDPNVLQEFDGTAEGANK